MGEQAEQSLVESSLHGDLPPGTELPRIGRMSLGPLPTGFSLHRTAMSHGWCALAPTAYDEQRRVLHRTVDLPDAGPLTISVGQGRDGRVMATWGRVKGSCDDRIAIKAQARHMLALDTDLGELHAVCRTRPDLAWVAECDAGRLLRSPTVFEDLAKTLATTNCSWALTTIMCRRLVDSLGAEGPAGERAFPTPAAVAAAGEPHLVDVVRAGYRARAFVELGERVRSGAIDADRWFDPAVDDADVLTEITSLRGFGPYASEGMLGLLGRPRGLAIDSWVRSKLPRLLGKKSMTDKQIAARYKGLGRWAGAGLWLELTRDWHDPTPD